MRVARLALSDFRNYARLDLALGDGLTIVVGDNGQGKTNLLEAVMIASRLRSPRTDQLKDTIAWGAGCAAIHAFCESQNRPRRLDVAIGPGGPAVKLNGETPRRRADAIGAVLAVLFTPDDLRLVKDEPERRRGFLDGLLSLVRPSLAGLPSEYSRALRQRNALIKQVREGSAGASQLEAWDEQVVKSGSALAVARAEVADALAGKAGEHHARLSGARELTMSYQSYILEEGREQAAIGARFRRGLAERRSEELGRGLTLVGPHRDDLAIGLGGHSARSFASQGQQRSIVLSMKLAELDVIELARGDAPVLLLDDVMSELDRDRRAALAETLAGLEQAIVTTTTPEYFTGALPAGVRWLRLSGGTATEGSP